MNYGLAYAVGFHPWEDADKETGFVAKFSELFDREETGRTPPYGKALDLGCGSAIWGIRYPLCTLKFGTFIRLQMVRGAGPIVRGQEATHRFAASRYAQTGHDRAEDRLRD